MFFKKKLQKINIFSQCRNYGLSLWECPQFLFLIMGLIISTSSILVYLIGIHYIEDRRIIILMILSMAAILFIISFIIVNSFEKLAEANRMKSEFVAIVSHQLRTPLSNFRWAVESLTSGKLEKYKKEEREYFKILQDSSVKMEELISDLLIVSRIQEGKLPLEKNWVSLDKIVTEVISEFRILAKTFNVKVEFELEKELPKVFIDSSRIKLVIENLLENAIHYGKKIKNNNSKKTKKLIRIKLYKNNNNLKFEISDNGIGVPKKDKKYIFRKFFRSQSVVRYQTEGSGLGLFIAKSVINDSNGRIWFKSEENKGSTFYFTIPIKT